MLLLTLAPALLVIGLTPGFTTQDGPAHVYSARILNASLVGGSSFDSVFRVAWEPLPNWVGHLLTMVAVAVCSPEVANRAIAAATLVSFAAAIVALRWVVAGRGGIEVASVLASLLALNVTWLLGFTSFLLGASIATATLATWWSGRDRLDLSWSVGLGCLLVIGYFCHPISLGLTIGGLGLLTMTTPGSNRLSRAGWTVLSGVPLVPLVLAYRFLTRSGGGLEVVWDHLDPWSLSGWVSQVGWVDPLSLAAKTATPFEVSLGPVPPALLAPALWSLGGIGLLTALTWSRRDRTRRAWLIGGLALIGGGLIAPDTLGVKHGHYLPQRIVLLGLVSLIPWLDLRTDRLVAKVGVIALGLALGLQSVFLWDYARTSQARVLPFLKLAQEFQPGDRVGTLLHTIRGRFRSNPLLHADGLLATATDSIFWTNYETAQYYFPVRVRPDIAHPVATRFEQVAILDDPIDATRRARLWQELLHDHGSQIGKIVEWQSDPSLERITRKDYEVVAEQGPVRVWSRHVDAP